MKLYKIWQTVNNGYDTYDSAVVAAESPAAARLIHPNGTGQALDDPEAWSGSWVDSIADVQVRCLGDAGGDITAGVIVHSFNAG